MNFAYATYLCALGLVLPAVIHTFHRGEAAQGRLSLAGFLGGMAGVIVCGALSDRWGRKALLLGGAACYALGMWLFSRATNFGTALALMPLIGAGGGATTTVACALAADLIPARRALILNATQVAFGMGAIVMPWVVSRSLASGVDWPVLYHVLAGGLAVLFAAVLVQAIPRGPAGERSEERRTVRNVTGQPAFWLLWFTQVLYAGVEISFWLWTPTYLASHIAGGGAWAGRIVPLFWIAMTLGRMLTGFLLERFALMNLLAGMASGGALCGFLLLFAHSAGAIVLWIVLAGLAMSGSYCVLIAELGERFPRDMGTALGGIAAAGGVGGALLPWALGELTRTSFGWTGALALLPLGSVGIVLLARRLARQPGEALSGVLSEQVRSL